MTRRAQKWTIGDVFTIPTCDGRYGVGQVIAQEPQALNSVTVALLDHLCAAADEATRCDLSESHVFSVVFSTRDLLDSGSWQVVGNRAVSISRALFPFEGTRQAGFVGAKIIGSAILTEFINAFHGLVPWDDWKDPMYLDKLLISSDRKPQRLMYKTGKP